MSGCRWMYKEVVVHIHNGILLSYKKEHIWVSSNEVDEAGAYYTEWNKWEREIAIQYINKYIWDEERQWQWSYMQGSKKVTDVENRLLDYLGEVEGGMIWEKSIETCILPYVKQMINASWMPEAGHSKPVLWDNPEGWGGEGGGRGSRLVGRCMCSHSWFVSMCGRGHHSVVKWLSSN